MSKFNVGDAVNIIPDQGRPIPAVISELVRGEDGEDRYAVHGFMGLYDEDQLEAKEESR